jgi:hypothetical protein
MEQSSGFDAISLFPLNTVIVASSNKAVQSNRTDDENAAVTVNTDVVSLWFPLNVPSQPSSAAYVSVSDSNRRLECESKRVSPLINLRRASVRSKYFK